MSLTHFPLGISTLITLEALLVAKAQRCQKLPINFILEDSFRKILFRGLCNNDLSSTFSENRGRLIAGKAKGNRVDFLFYNFAVLANKDKSIVGSWNGTK